MISFRPPSGRRPARRIALALSAVALLAVSACGFDAETLQPYTPGNGVNVDIGLGPNQQVVSGTVQARNLVIVSDAAGEGFLYGSLYTEDSDALTAVSGNAIKVDGSQGSALNAVVTSPVTVANSELVVITDQQRITMTSADLAPGLTANLTLTFRNAGSRQVLVPVVDGSLEPYDQIPSATPSASGSASGSPARRPPRRPDPAGFDPTGFDPTGQPMVTSSPNRLLTDSPQ